MKCPSWLDIFNFLTLVHLSYHLWDRSQEGRIFVVHGKGKQIKIFVFFKARFIKLFRYVAFIPCTHVGFFLTNIFSTLFKKKSNPQTCVDLAKNHSGGFFKEKIALPNDWKLQKLDFVLYRPFKIERTQILTFGFSAFLCGWLANHQRICPFCEISRYVWTGHWTQTVFGFCFYIHWYTNQRFTSKYVIY